MYIEVIPLDTSPDSSALTYFASEELRGSFQIGSLVEVPLRNNLSLAIVTHLDTEPEGPIENIRSIVSVISGNPLLAAYQIESTLFIARRYFVHAHRAASMFLSKSLVTYLGKKSYIQLNTSPHIEERSPEKPRLVHCPETSDINMMISAYLDARQDIAVIFPDDFAIEGYLAHSPMTDTQTQNTLVIRDAITDTQRYKRWIDVYNGEKKIIIGTRRLLYYNLSHYSQILYIEDSLCRSLLRFQHAYKNTEVLRHITRTGRFKTTILSTIPSIESLYLAHSGEYRLDKNLDAQ